MTPDWHRIQDLFHRASALEGDAQEAFLLGECGDDEALLSEVRSLLSAAGPGSEASATTPASAPPPIRDPILGTTVDQYSIKRVIGEGGMGVVYEALQQSPRRTVALKMMKRGVTSRSALRRFEYEAQTLGRLRHDGIAQIYQAGTWDDGSGSRPWFAMEYLPGAKTLTRYCKDKKFGTRERLDIFRKVCAAVQHGHAKGIIHRDLKPSNILVTSSGVPKIIDFGVARSTDSDMAVTTLQTDVGALIGTLQYMSPEQCDADPNDIDTRSDVYALGVVLYELLCDQPPYALRHAAIHEAARIIREEEPTKPSSLDKRLRGDIETITLKALEKDRDRRYQSATALEEDIDRYLAGDSIAAKAPSAIDYLKRFARKHKAAAASIAVIFVVLVGAVIAISIFAARTERQRVVAEKAEQKAVQERAHSESGSFLLEVAIADSKQAQAEVEQERLEALRSTYRGNYHAASASLSEGDVAGARKWLEKAKAAMISSQSSRSNAESVLDTLVAAGEITERQKKEKLNEMRLASAEHSLVREDYAQTDAFKIEQMDMPFEWQYLYARSDDAIVTLRGHEGSVESTTFSPDGQRLASGSGDRTIRIWDAGSGEELFVLRGHEQRVNSVTFSPDGQRLASGSGDHTIRIWDAGSGKELAVLRGYSAGVRSVTFSPDGQRLALAGSDHTIRLWDAGSGEELAVLRGHEGPVEAVTFSPNGQRLASASWDNTIRIWGAGSGEELAVLRGHEGRVEEVTFSPDGTRLASGSFDNTIRLWETKSRGQIAQDRRLSQKEMLRLTPLVETWIEKSGGDTEVLLAILERESKNHSFKEQATLRNIVLRSLQSQRDANYLKRLSDALPEMIKTAWDSAQLLNEIALKAATSEDHAFFAAVSSDALRASQRSCELTGYEYAAYLDTLARVHFERGELDEAIKWQELAMQHIPGVMHHIEGVEDKGIYQESLDRYREAAKQDAQE